MSWNRREILRGLGASSLLFAFGCGAPAKAVHFAPQESGQVRTWLRDAVARLSTVYPSVHVLAVSRRRSTSAIDVLGTGVAHARRDGVVFTLRDRDGAWREHVTADLSQLGVASAVRLLAGAAKPAAIAFGDEPPAARVLPPVDDGTLRNRAEAIHHNDHAGSGRIIYAAALVEIEDVTVWSVAPGRDREHSARRIRKRVTRAAWNGTRPLISEVERGWIGELDDETLDVADVTEASQRVLQPMTPGAFDDGERTVVLEPSVTAAILDAAVRGLLTSRATRRPEVARRLALGATIAAPALTLVDDPTTPGAYGGFAFDDEGEPAEAITLIEHGRLTGRLADRAAVDAHLAPTAGRARRPGHVGELEVAPSHLRLAPGPLTTRQLLDDGVILEGGNGAVFDPSSDRIVVRAARARELKGGSATGRIYGDVELAGELSALLAAVTGVGADSATSVIRDELGGEPAWRSIAAPWLRTRGLVRARRRVT